MNPLIKWPGGKSSEINRIEHLIPQHTRYVEPFFGGGALFFHLMPQTAAINDISGSLIEYYRLIKEQDIELQNLLLCYSNSFNSVLDHCNRNYSDILTVYNDVATDKIDREQVKEQIGGIAKGLSSKINSGFSEGLLLNEQEFIEHLVKMSTDKIMRTLINNAKTPFTPEDLKNNLITGFASGYYMYFRKIYNDLNLHRIESPSLAYKAANFCFIREYCYGSMFRYNAKGEFNIPYGGISYNTKNFKIKMENMFNKDVETIFKNTDICSLDFEDFFKKASLNGQDFVFLDPPYDTEFSNYDGNDFTHKDQERLLHALEKTSAQFILIIKNTDFISRLYEDKFNILAFDNKYMYNVRSRNDRDVEHLIITNLRV